MGHDINSTTGIPKAKQILSNTTVKSNNGSGVYPMPADINNNGTYSLPISGIVQDNRGIDLDGYSSNPNFSNKSQEIIFTDTNKNGIIDAGDILKYKENNKEVSTAIKRTRLGTMPAQQNIELANGKEIVTSRSNKLQAEAIFKFEENAVTPDGKALKYTEALEQANSAKDPNLFKEVVRYEGALNYMLGTTMDVSGPRLQDKIQQAKKIDTNSKNKLIIPLQIAVADTLKDTRQVYEVGFGRRETLSLKATRQFIEAPALEKLKQPIDRKSMKESIRPDNSDAWQY